MLERTRDKREVQMPLFGHNYGFKPNVQIKAEFPLLYVHPVGEGHEFGLGDTLIGIKWRFIEEEMGRLQLAIYPQGVLPTGDSKRRRIATTSGIQRLCSPAMSSNE